MPASDFWTRCWLGIGQNVHVVNEYDRDYGDEGTVAVGLYCQLCDPATCHDCTQIY